MTRIGIICALRREAACIITRPPPPGQVAPIGSRCSLLICGMGAERAGNAALELANSGIGVLVSWGTAAALTAGIRPGDLIVPETLVGEDGRSYRTARTWRDRLLRRLHECPGNIYLGSLAHSAQVLTGTRDKNDLYTRTQAMAADMESAAVAAVAEQHGLELLVVRAVADAAASAVPDLLLRSCDPYGRVRALPLARALLQHPALIASLVRLGSEYHAARRTLRWIGPRLDPILASD